ncbi:MAG: adenylosuccinate lyase [Flavobacteriales bacterium]
MTTELFAISPLDGRYHQQIRELSPYFSEFALFRYRVLVEIEYFIELSKAKLKQFQPLHEDVQTLLRAIYVDFNEEDAQKIKQIERTTNHDIKAVEYFIKEKLHALGMEKVSEFVHFALTSQDINNTAIPLSLKDAHQQVILPMFNELVALLKQLALEWKDIPMLARTHGQAASPTALGKEIMVFVERLQAQMDLINQTRWSAKFGGATGNFNAHKVAYPQVNWPQFADHFVNDILGLHRSRTTTQIEHYDHLAYYFDGLKRIHTILLDLCRDFWTYISMDYFKQKIREGEVGSSAMPHKVNPIDFENAEGNLGLANALLEHLSAKLPISRLQRDLTDSTVLRNVGVPMGHSLVAVKAIMKGLNKLIVNQDTIKADLEKNCVVVAEAIQTILRREGVEKPYELLKDLTRKNKTLNMGDIREFIHQLPVNDAIKAELLTIDAQNYIGYSNDFF